MHKAKALGYNPSAFFFPSEVCSGKQAENIRIPPSKEQ